ncbi:glycosyltransferase family 2 protein [Chitinophaga sp. G-6-1-13]|uniref:Glycosyltransferase family 2 protein n=1 Tax=Chitinophaga fulva TaxID=2728842 RepID=A0A848GF27_9BACT|nr:glycosyltransferase family 2 protein [Chitinophaga fulva]
MLQHKISCCTVCMNRTMHLKETLLRNMQDNAGYRPLEFVLLNYGSTDDLHEWAQQTLSPYIESGLLVYYHNPEPAYFHMSHAKNMAFRLASGDILCSIDADNYTGTGFTAYVNRSFNEEPAAFLSPAGIGPGKKWWDVQGRICLKKEDFRKLHGYDERVMDYGYEDQDFKSRLLALGKKKVIIRDPAYLQAIRHDDTLRIASGFTTSKIKDLLVGNYCEQTSEVICLQNDFTFERFFVDRDLLHYESTQEDIHPKRRYAGTYQIRDNDIRLYKENGTAYLQLTLQDEDTLLAADNRLFHRVTSPVLLNNFLLQRAIYLGRQVFFRNRKKPSCVNPDGYGRGKVYRNFSTEPLLLT